MPMTSSRSLLSDVQIWTLSLSNSLLTESLDKYFKRLMIDNCFYNYSAPVHGAHRNLKSLYLSYPFPTRSHLNEVMSITYLELLAAFPNLTFIQLNADNPDFEAESVLRAVSIVRAQKGLEQAFPSLQLETRLPYGFPLGYERDQMCSEHIMKANMAKLRVTFQSICLGNMSDVKRIKEMVTLNGPTLTTLIASMMHPLVQRSKFPFGVQLDQLQLLTLSEDFCESFEFIKYTPNLSRLIIEDASATGKVLPERIPRMTNLVANSPMSELANVRLLKLTSFKMQSMVSEDGLKWLIKWFPNVKELEMYLDDNQFAMVCQNWQRLVKLEVYGDELTDEGVTGLTFPRGIPQSKKIPLDSQPQRANITSLRSLKEFSFIGARLTELSVFHGFLKNESLRKIVFGNQFRKSMLGKRAKAELDKKQVKMIDFSKSKAKYYIYDLPAAVANNRALQYWTLINKLPRL